MGCGASADRVQELSSTVKDENPIHPTCERFSFEEGARRSQSEPLGGSKRRKPQRVRALSLGSDECRDIYDSVQTKKGLFWTSGESWMSGVPSAPSRQLTS
ncbi:unnamed protein product [Symbiodinium natans]|uniref:Uncharacterized protein n=1 Tax=Symbiodinium natans TaxID=878477 RepID=A0A812PXB4_9DINO|nr:unnamed protein product [Symbiodinium natans]